MKFLKAGLIVVVLAVGAAAFFLERQSNVQLHVSMYCPEICQLDI